jgi:hypothetical protein
LKDDPFPERPGGVTKAIQERILLWKCHPW